MKKMNSKFQPQKKICAYFVKFLGNNTERYPNRKKEKHSITFFYNTLVIFLFLKKKEKKGKHVHHYLIYFFAFNIKYKNS